MPVEAIGAMSWAFVAFLVALEILALFAIYRLLKSDRLSGLILESDGSKASLSRLQALVFTFVVAGLFMVFSLDIGDFVEIPQTVLGLLGISGGTYLISKGMSKTDEGTAKAPAGGGAANPPAANPPAQVP